MNQENESLGSGGQETHDEDQGQSSLPTLGQATGLGGPSGDAQSTSEGPALRSAPSFSQHSDASWQDNLDSGSSSAWLQGSSLQTDLDPADSVDRLTRSSFSNLSVPRSVSEQSNVSGDGSFADYSGMQQSGAADDSALNALMDAHSSTELSQPSAQSDSLQEGEGMHRSPSSHSSHRPSKRDASFGLDPDVDKQHSIRGQPLVSHLLHSQHHSHHHHHPHAPSHTTAATGAPETTISGIPDTHTVPTVSATGMPRIFPRRTSRSRSRDSFGDEKGGSHHDGRKGRRRSSNRLSRTSSMSDEEADEPRELQPSYAPSGSLTLALFSSGITWRRRSYLLLASVAINIGLPFINGVMLGFGEIFARSIIAPLIGLAPAAININAPAATTAVEAASRFNAGKASTSGVGIRHAGRAEHQGRR